MAGLSAGSVPHLPRGVRLHHDTIRNTHVLLAPERAFDLDTIAVEVLKLVDGKRDVSAIIDLLAERFEAERTVIEADVMDMLTGLLNKRILES